MEYGPTRIRSGARRSHSEAITIARWIPNDQGVIFALGTEVHIVVRKP